MFGLLSDVTLTGNAVRLVPLHREHADKLWQVVAKDAEDVFRWFPTTLTSLADLRDFVDIATSERRSDRALPFLVERKHDGAVLGSTRFANIDLPNSRAEIGWTWLIPSAQRSAANTEMKRMMLSHGFERMGLNRVEFKTDSLNLKSRRALSRIGAVEEGTLRNHVVCHTGRLRHSVYFSILKAEWPQVRDRLDARMRVSGPMIAERPMEVA